MKPTMLALALLASSATTSAATRYMAMAGTDAGDCSQEPAPCATLGYAMSVMQSGDTLLIDDGHYTSAANLIDQFHTPPSGTPATWTVIRARNIPCQEGAPCDAPLRVRFSDAAIFDCTAATGDVSFVKFWGIRWDGIQTCPGWNHLYFKQIASQGVRDGNTSSIGISGQRNLLEDVVAFGKGRYKILFYDVSRDLQSYGPGDNLCRRCVVRQDWAKKNDPSADPIGGIVSYFNRGTACLNCLVIDSDTPSEWYDGSNNELCGAFAQVVDPGAHGFIVAGSLAVNVAMAAYNNRQQSSGHLLRDFAAVKVAGGLGLQGDTEVDRVTIVNAATSNFSFRSAAQADAILAPNDGVFSFAGQTTLTNSIFRDLAGDGIRGGGVSSDYLNLFNVGGGSFTVGAPAAPHLFTTDPWENGLSHPPTVEAGSTLASAGAHGGPMGARILYRLGVDASFKGDTGWDTEQSAPLWPWPLEDWIQAEMRSSEYTTDANRGFCAAGQTLTNYIWGQFGNAPPSFDTTDSGTPDDGAPSHSVPHGCDCSAGASPAALAILCLVRRRRRREQE